MDTLYDVISGLGGTIFGVVVTTLLNRGRTRRMNALLLSTQQKVDEQATENKRLMDVVRQKENLILELERRILDVERPKKKRGK